MESKKKFLLENDFSSGIFLFAFHCLLLILLSSVLIMVLLNGVHLLLVGLAGLVGFFSGGCVMLACV